MGPYEGEQLDPSDALNTKFINFTFLLFNVKFLFTTAYSFN
jgi:hypothetical protein